MQGILVWTGRLLNISSEALWSRMKSAYMVAWEFSYVRFYNTLRNPHYERSKGKRVLSLKDISSFNFQENFSARATGQLDFRERLSGSFIILGKYKNFRILCYSPDGIIFSVVSSIERLKVCVPCQILYIMSSLHIQEKEKDTCIPDICYRAWVLLQVGHSTPTI